MCDLGIIMSAYLINLIHINKKDSHGPPMAVFPVISLSYKIYLSALIGLFKKSR